MKLYIILFLLAILTMVNAKPPEPKPTKAPDGPCNKSKNCMDCCKKHTACVQQCNFFRSKPICAKQCAEESCTEGWAFCSTECDLWWCKGDIDHQIPLEELTPCGESGEMGCGH